MFQDPARVDGKLGQLPRDPDKMRAGDIHPLPNLDPNRVHLHG